MISQERHIRKHCQKRGQAKMIHRCDYSLKEKNMAAIDLSTPFPRPTSSTDMCEELVMDDDLDNSLIETN